MTPFRKRLLRRELLTVYHQAGNYLLFEATAFSALSLAVNPPPTQGEFDEVTKALEADRQIVRLRVDDEVKTKITSEGEAALL